MISHRLQSSNPKGSTSSGQRGACASQQAGIFETLLALVAAEDVGIHQLDIKAANLSDDRQEKAQHGLLTVELEASTQSSNTTHLRQQLESKR
ncbi:TPA: hypothetical protein ACH3X3_003461 [Trebouxia sp. C0006]